MWDYGDGGGREMDKIDTSTTENQIIWIWNKQRFRIMK